MKNNVLNDVLHWLEEEIHSLQDEIHVRTETLNSLQKLTTDLKEYHDTTNYKEKYEEILEEYEKEKQRLIKLHNHYRQIEEEHNKIKSELKGWQDWFYSNRDIYDKLFSAAPTGILRAPPEEPPAVKKKTTKKKVKKKKKKK